MSSRRNRDQSIDPAKAVQPEDFMDEEVRYAPPISCDKLFHGLKHILTCRILVNSVLPRDTFELAENTTTITSLAHFPRRLVENLLYQTPVIFSSECSFLVGESRISSIHPLEDCHRA